MSSEILEESNRELELPPSWAQLRVVEVFEIVSTAGKRIKQGEYQSSGALPVIDQGEVFIGGYTNKVRAGPQRLDRDRGLLARILQTRRETWQGRGKYKYKEPAAPDTSDLPELPEGWVWASVEQLAKVIGGLTKNSKRRNLPLRKPMLRVANVYQNRLDLSSIHETGVTPTECDRVRLKDRDLLVVEGNGSKDQIGRMAIWRNEIPDAVHQNHLIKVRMVEKALVEFALWWFQSLSGRRNIEKTASSTSGLYTLSISKIEALVVPVPGLDEVAEINERIDEAFTKTDHLEALCETELARSAALRQSILKNAFAGRLVAQDPTDEPAAELLTRIHVARQAAPKGKTGGKATA